MAINPGRLRLKLEILQPVSTKDPDTGEYTPESFTVFDTVWGGIEPLNARERVELDSNAMLAEATGKIVIRYLAGIRTTFRVRDVISGRVFQILGIINPVERNELLTLFVREWYDES